MGFLDKAEARIEDTVGSMFAKLSKRQLQPIEISQAIKNAMDIAAKRGTGDKVLVPHRYLIKLNPHDKQDISDQLLTAIGKEIADYANQKNFRVTSEIELGLSEDSSVGRGRVKVGSAAISKVVTWKPVISFGSIRHELRNGTTTFGRDDQAEVMIDDRGLSRIHFEIAFNGEIAAIRDLESTNGTFVDGNRVNELVLRQGSVITAGRTEFAFELLALTGESSE